jgi:hypothetical protein
MPWAVVDNAAEVLDLFEHWRAEPRIRVGSGPRSILPGAQRGRRRRLQDRNLQWTNHSWLGIAPAPLAAGFPGFATGVKGAYG